jgi:hypothetical protein
MNCLSRALAIPLLLLLAAAPAPTAAPTPLLHAHAHNDYEHARPLDEALENGFCSIEADVHLVDGQLLVAHKREECRADRTLQSLYLDPLRARARAGGGRIFPGWPSIVLLIDMKVPKDETPDATYAVLRSLLARYREMLTTWSGDAKQERAVMVVLTGDRPPRALVAAERERPCALDGGLSDLDVQPSPSPDLVPMISAKWEDSFTWRGEGAMPEPERARLRELARKAEPQHRTLRFWAAPDQPGAWAELRAAGVQLINTDHLAQCRAFLLREGHE